MNIYVASSWKNQFFNDVVVALTQLGHNVYDFRNPKTSFDWRHIDPDWEKWDYDQFIKYRAHPLALRGFAHDSVALKACDACVMVLPCGDSSHIELGWAAGNGKSTFILWAPGTRADLMYSLADHVCPDLGSLIELIGPGEDKELFDAS